MPSELRARIQNEIHSTQKRPPVATMTRHSAANRSPNPRKNDNRKNDPRKPDPLKNKIQQRQAQVGIIGLGYVGLPLALLYSEQKFPVTGFDIDQRKVETLAKGGSYIYRITPEEIRTAKAQGFSATANYSQISAMDAIIICVPTPLNEYHERD